MPGDLFHQGWQRVIAEPFDRAPDSLGAADAGEHRQLKAEMGKAVAHGARQRRPRDRGGGCPDRFGD